MERHNAEPPTLSSPPPAESGISLALDAIGFEDAPGDDGYLRFAENRGPPPVPVALDQRRPGSASPTPPPSHRAPPPSIKTARPATAASAATSASASPTRALLSLSALRKNHESQLVAKQMAKSHQILQMLQTSGGGGTPLVPNEEYVSRLLLRRQMLQNKLNEKVLDIFQGIASKAAGLKNTIEMERRRRSIRSLLAQAQARGQDVEIVEPLMELFTSRSDPLAALLRELISRSRGLLQMAAVQDEGAANTTLDRVLDEIGMAEYQLLDVLRDQYEELQEEGLELALKLTLQQYLFSSALSTALLSQIRRRCAEEDQRILQCFVSGGWEDLFARLKIRGKLQLPRDRPLDAFPIGDSGIYGRAVEEFRLLSIESTPGAKLTALTRGCTAICQAIDDYRRDGGGPRPPSPQDEQPGESGGIGGGGSAASALGSEDLLLLVAYCLVRAQIPDLASQLLFVSRLVPEEMVRGEAGYVLATVQTSLDYALSQLEAGTSQG